MKRTFVQITQGEKFVYEIEQRKWLDGKEKKGVKKCVMFGKK